MKATSGALVGVAIEGGEMNWMELCEIAEIADLVVAVPSPEVALVAPDRVEELAALLGGYGIAIREGPINVTQTPGGVAELRAVVKRYKNDPEALLDAIRAAGMLGKLDRARGRY